MNIRYFAAAAIFAAALGAGSLAPSVAQAMPGPIAPAQAIQSPLQAEQVRLVCKRVRRGRHWTRHCYHTPSRAYRHHRHYRHYDRHHHRHRYYR